MSQPSPPPSVSPAIPVVEMAPPVTAKPCSPAAALSSAHVTPPSARAVRAFGVDLDVPHLGQVDHHGVVRDGEPADVVPAAPDGDLVPATTGEAHRRGHVGRGPAAHDQRRSAIDQPVVDSPGVVIAFIARAAAADR